MHTRLFPMMLAAALCLAPILSVPAAEPPMKALLVTFVLQAAALLGLFAVGGTMPLALVFVFSLALLMYLFSVSCITHFMDVARSRHPKSMVLASSVEPMAFNVGISFGTAVGGAVVSSAGIAYVGAVGAAL